MLALPPGPYLFVDIETTGLTHDDRIVSMGTIELPSLDAIKEEGALGAIHLIFNPGRPSHPRARKVHGFSDKVLANQELFSDYAEQLRDLFEGAGTIIAHNSSFDERFVRNEMAAAGYPLSDRRFYCTMKAYRMENEGSAALKAILARMGISRQGKHHGALEDAWLSMQVFCWLHGHPSYGLGDIVPPANFRDGAPPVSPLLSAPKSQPVEIKPDPATLRALYKYALPAGTLMMAVANADGLVDQSELDVINLMIGDVAEHLTLGDSPSLIGETSNTISLLKYVQPDIDAATQAIIKDPFLASNIAGWLKQVTVADGVASNVEVQILMCIAESIKLTNKH